MTKHSSRYFRKLHHDYYGPRWNTIITRIDYYDYSRAHRFNAITEQGYFFFSSCSTLVNNSYSQYIRYVSTPLNLPSPFTSLAHGSVNPLCLKAPYNVIKRTYRGTGQNCIAASLKRKRALSLSVSVSLNGNVSTLGPPMKQSSRCLCRIINDYGTGKERETNERARTAVGRNFRGGGPRY